MTFCYHNRIDDLRAQYLIERLWNIGRKDVEYPYFFEFIKLVSNTSISSFKLFNRYANDKRFEYLDMSIVAKDVHPNVNSIISGFVPTINPRFVQVMTEKGICFSVNSLLQSQLMGTKYIFFLFIMNIVNNRIERQNILSYQILLLSSYFRFSMSQRSEARFNSTHMSISKISMHNEVGSFRSKN
jgi:hypothetical protein